MVQSSTAIPNTEGTVLPGAEEHPQASDGKFKWPLLPHTLSPDYPPFQAAGGPRFSCKVQYEEEKNKRAAARHCVTKYLMYLVLKVGTHCACYAQMLSGNSSCKRSTRATQQNATVTVSTSQEKLKSKLDTIYSSPNHKTFISCQR